jgi:hypothetical protein
VPKRALQHTLTELSTGKLQALVSPAASHVLPAHREWVDLFDLDMPVILAHLRSLTLRCATMRAALSTAVTELDILMQSFLNKHALTSSEDIANYLRTFNIIVDVGRGIFPPQEAYRSAITTFGLFVTDLINLLPKGSPLRTRMRAEFDKDMVGADAQEEAVRKLIRDLVHGTCKGGERYALAVYLGIMRQRFKNWSAEEERFNARANECVVALL